jgi:hypothetical protein
VLYSISSVFLLDSIYSMYYLATSWRYEAQCGPFCGGPLVRQNKNKLKLKTEHREQLFALLTQWTDLKKTRGPNKQGAEN